MKILHAVEWQQSLSLYQLNSLFDRYQCYESISKLKTKNSIQILVFNYLKQLHATSHSRRRKFSQIMTMSIIILSECIIQKLLTKLIIKMAEK